MMYEIHLYVPKTGRLTPAMIQWLYEHGEDENQPEAFWPVRKLKPYALARALLRFDPSLIASQGPGQDVELRYPMEELGLRLYVHNRGVIMLFPFMGAMLAQIVLRIGYTYIRYLYDHAGFWSFDPQLKVISYADDFQSIDETVEMMERLLPKLLP
ncbi:MAG: hypothetical protein SNJ59_12435 [Aggregatilineales bacterium]